jgi:hypothetical protein
MFGCEVLFYEILRLFLSTIKKNTQKFKNRIELKVLNEGSNVLFISQKKGHGGLQCGVRVSFRKVGDC